MRKRLIVASLFSFFAGLFGSGSAAADYKVAEVYAGLRKMVFETKPADIGLKPPGNDVWGLIMETGYPKWWSRWLLSKMAP